MYQLSLLSALPLVNVLVCIANINLLPEDICCYLQACNIVVLMLVMSCSYACVKRLIQIYIYIYSCYPLTYMDTCPYCTVLPKAINIVVYL